LLVYLWVNPLLLPARSFGGWRRWPAKRQARTSGAERKRREVEVDSILEKVARSGMESLSEEERGLLEETSGKYRRRAESKKPRSGLSI
jgi:uncharacterized protein DUF6576